MGTHFSFLFSIYSENHGVQAEPLNFATSSDITYVTGLFDTDGWLSNVTCTEHIFDQTSHHIVRYRVCDICSLCFAHTQTCGCHVFTKKECVTVLWLATLSIYNNHIQSLLWEITDGFHLTARFPF